MPPMKIFNIQILRHIEHACCKGALTRVFPGLRLAIRNPTVMVPVGILLLPNMDSRWPRSSDRGPSKAVGHEVDYRLLREVVDRIACFSMREARVSRLR